LVDGEPFGRSVNADDWLGLEIYVCEYAPQQAWWWADRRYKDNDAAVVGASVRQGHDDWETAPPASVCAVPASSEFATKCDGVR